MGWKMPFYPIPIIITIAIWIYILKSTGEDMWQNGLMILGLGVVAYFIKAAISKEWPFKKTLEI
ncbi:MAG: hypothetical protein EBX50_22245 [Chitinophagia bacterium]|nr:hypothetical protein [Chitinophagia bacterium]